MKDRNSSSFIRFQCILLDSAVLFSSFWNFVKLKNGDLISLEEPILQNGWSIWSTLLYLNFRSLKDSNSLSFIRFQCFLHDSAVLFSAFLNFVKLKRGDLISPGDPILQNGWIIWSPLLYFNFRNFKDPNSLSFIRFKCILHNSSALFSSFWNFLKLKRRNLNSLGNQFCRTDELFGPPSVFQF